MGRKRKQRRQPHGSAWHWKQTDWWYYTMPGTQKRFPLFDEGGQRIRGKANKEAAELALAKERLSWDDDGRRAPMVRGWWPECARSTSSTANAAWPTARLAKAIETAR